MTDGSLPWGEVGEWLPHRPAGPISTHQGRFYTTSAHASHREKGTAEHEGPWGREDSLLRNLRGLLHLILETSMSSVRDLEGASLPCNAYSCISMHGSKDM